MRISAYVMKDSNMWWKENESAPFDHSLIDHSHSQQLVSRGFPLFKRCEWLVVNRIRPTNAFWKNKL